MRDLTWVHDALSSPPSQQNEKHVPVTAVIANVGPSEHKFGPLLTVIGRMCFLCESQFINVVSLGFVSIPEIRKFRTKNIIISSRSPQNLVCQRVERNNIPQF